MLLFLVNVAVVINRNDLNHRAFAWLVLVVEFFLKLNEGSKK